jgi:hypothetical protein
MLVPVERAAEAGHRNGRLHPCQTVKQTEVPRVVDGSLAKTDASALDDERGIYRCVGVHSVRAQLKLIDPCRRMVVSAPVVELGACFVMRKR